MPKAVVENLRSAVYSCHEEISSQVQADSALDAKLFGLLSFLAAAGSLLLTLPGGLGDGRVLLLAGAGLGALACLAGSIGGSSPNVGPPPEKFYADYGAEAEIDFLEQLLADMSATARFNYLALALRRRALAIAIAAPLLLTILYGFVSVT